ncbi:MAG TPA: CHRD domain-containing protein [Gemmatimonadota bacterium]|nr:CHRD domain-containing protein [Gemmatimonadota bacterium]
MNRVFLSAITLTVLLACTESEAPLDSTAELVLSGPGPVANFVTPLKGREEVPPVETRATGLAKFKLSKDGTSLGYKLIASHIEGVTQAHIHCGAPGVNGPVVIFLFGFDPAGVDSNGILAQGTLTPAGLIPRPDSPECPGGIADFEDLIERMRSGGTYANVHTLANPGGEIRGHIDHGNGVE